MPRRGVTVSEQRQRFLEDYQLNYYTMTELAERFSISGRTARCCVPRDTSRGWPGGFPQRTPHKERPAQNVPHRTRDLRRDFASRGRQAHSGSARRGLSNRAFLGTCGCVPSSSRIGVE